MRQVRLGTTALVAVVLALGTPGATQLGSAASGIKTQTLDQFRGRAQGENAGIMEFGAQKRTRKVAPGPVASRRAEPRTRGAGTGGGDVNEVEPNDSSPQFIADIPVNVRGTISSASDIGDCFNVQVSEGDSVRIEVVADRIFESSLDSIIIVFERDGTTVVLENDDGGFENSLDSFARFTATYTGIYTVCVQDAQGRGDPSFFYVLNVTVASTADFVEQEPNGDPLLSDRVPLPSLVRGTMGSADEHDFFTFQGVGGTTLVVDVDAAIFLSSLDSVVVLYDATGRVLFAYDDDDGDPSNPDTRFNIVLPNSGTYYLSVGDALGGGGQSSDRYYSLGLTVQSGDGAPRVDRVKLTSANSAKKVIGSGFGQSNAFAELTAGGAVARRLAGRNARANPTGAIKLTPPTTVSAGDVFTVVLSNGRRSNPRVLN
jgi:hypothetical protein